jgi:competence protein ComEA
VTPAAASGSATSPSPPGSATATAPQGGITADGKVILNLATLDELTRLPGIGQKRAEKIVQLRERLGRFKKPTDLLRIKGIGPKSLRKMLPHLVLDPPTAG